MERNTLIRLVKEAQSGDTKAMGELFSAFTASLDSELGEYEIVYDYLLGADSANIDGRTDDAYIPVRHDPVLMDISVGVLSDLNEEEMSHLTGICQKQQGPVNEKAFAECVQIILGENQASSITTDDDLMAFRNKLKERKGTKQ